VDCSHGFFVLTLPGPAGDYNRLKVPAGVTGPITPAVEAQLNERQKRMVSLLAAGERLTSRRCEEEFGVTRDTAARDFALLMGLGIAARTGPGRSVSYHQRVPSNRQMHSRNRQIPPSITSEAGTLDMIALSREAGLKAPQFRQDGGTFVQTLWRPTAQATGQADAQATAQADEVVKPL
jgi:predicted HTH transcriptional regulator